MRKKFTASTMILLTNYSFSFDSGEDQIEQIIQKWFVQYPPKWVIAAIVEAIFLGRYKAVSVERILILWHLRGEPISHFDLEFVDLVCSRLVKGVLIHPPATHSVHRTASRAA